MPNMNTEMQLYALFAKNKPQMIEDMPSRIREYIMNLNSERVLCINKNAIPAILRQYSSGVNYGAIRFIPCGKDRGQSEYFGDEIQVIAAACIHDDKRVVLLSLMKDAPNVDGYLKGTLSYPQGHCEMDVSVTHMCAPDGTISLMNLYQKIRNDILREILEETRIDDTVMHRQYCKDLQEKIMTAPMGNFYPIYIERPGSTERHLCILLDINMTGTSFDSYCESIVSDEPEKHNVAVVSYTDLVELHRADIICPWVARSFSMIPFFSSTFISDYLVSCRRKCSY